MKFLLEGEVITIDASMNKTISTVRDELKQVVAPPDFHVDMISAGIERDPRVSSMMKKMNYRSGQGLGKNEQGNQNSQISKARVTRKDWDKRGLD